MTMNDAKEALGTLLKEYHGKGISVEIIVDSDLRGEHKLTLAMHKNAIGYVFLCSNDALDLLFDVSRAENLIEEKAAKEDLDLKALQLENAGYTVVPPGDPRADILGRAEK
ncbi:MAG: hypothetical protein LBS24_00615 [Clostridiales Family XIII bacterium]|jgi:hypothetical protein|nr:hypothetical protein [Clostridiales Family XIII bacterium]